MTAAVDSAGPPAPNIGGEAQRGVSSASARTSLMPHPSPSGVGEGTGSEEDALRHRVHGMTSAVDQLELKVGDVQRFYSSKQQQQPQRQGSGAKGVGSGGKERALAALAETGMRRLQAEAERREAASAKRSQELMRQFGTILRQIMQHKWAYPFMQPVDAEALGLHDYNEIIKKPMDFSTIKSRMDIKDGTGYKNVKEIYADARLIFTNAMTYNDERHDVHVMAKTLLNKLEEKWLQLLPKVMEEEARQQEEAAQAQLDLQNAEAAVVAKTALDTSKELDRICMQLNDFRGLILSKISSRKITSEEKREIATGLSRLHTEDLEKAINIIAEHNPSFQATSQSLELDIDAQNESTLWKLKFFIRSMLELQPKSYTTKSEENKQQKKRKKEISDALALAKTAKKAKKNPS